MGDLRIGVTGTGATSRRNVQTLVHDYLSAHGDDRVTFVLDCTLTDGHVSPAVAAVALYAMDTYLIEAVAASTEGKPDDEDGLLRRIGDVAVKSGLVANPAATVVRNSDVVFIAWDDTDESSMRALLAAEKHTVPAFDVTDGLLPLAFADTEDDTPEEDGKDDTPPFEPDEPGRPAEQTSAEQTGLERTAGVTPTPQTTLAAVDLDALGQLLAAYVIEAIKPLLPVKRGPGRPRKTVAE